MQNHITKNLTDKARPQNKPYRVHDSRLPGFTLRIQPSGAKSWVLLFKGKTRTLGRYPTMTVAMAREKARRIINGEEPMTPVEEQAPSSTPTLGEFIDEHYRDFADTNYANPAENISHLTRTGFLDKPLDQIQVLDAEKYRTARLKAGIAPSSINRQMAVLKACLKKAVDWQVIDKNPLAGFKQLKLDATPVVRYLEPDEEERLQEALLSATPWLRAFVNTALHTGCRRVELWELTWKDVDLEKGFLTVIGDVSAKSGQTRHIPLNETAVTTLTQWRGDAVPKKTTPVFGHHEFRKSWATLLKAADIHDFTFHCCRHTFASKLVMADISLFKVQTLLGHQSPAMTQRYAHLAPSNLHDAVAKIG